MAIDAQVSAFVQDGAEDPRTASILPDLLLNRLLHLLALEEPDWFAAKSTAAAVLDAYEALVDLVDATRREGSSANGSLFTDYNGQRKSERSSYQVSLTPVDFFNAFWIAVILGDARRLDLLAAMPIDAFSSQNVQADRSWTSESWVSLPLTAIACMALSKGYRVESTSAYLPLPLRLRMV
ncbi:hypothetical protein NCAST_31_00830 [Nocardia asteroides NBRC 15531]|uniref:Uncharacterized protein n=1 Tax=Nocardia asteroides NBRC 15531 TaxID=1110697 RepID=U5EJS8_NOCAS|nr:hypothetical protein NCAST_31_00830 [Nocardia asteroides NBRC 15531]